MGPAGYLVGYAIAADNLKLANNVIADSVNSRYYSAGLARCGFRKCSACVGN